MPIIFISLDIDIRRLLEIMDFQQYIEFINGPI